MQCLLVQSLISTSCLTSLWVVDQRLRELCLRAPAGGNISAAARKMSYFAVICWQSAIWRGGSSGNQSRVQCGKIGGIARIVGGNKKARSQVSKLGVTCPLFALLPNRNIPLWTDQTPMTTTSKIQKYQKYCKIFQDLHELQISKIHFATLSRTRVSNEHPLINTWKSVEWRTLCKKYFNTELKTLVSSSSFCLIVRNFRVLNVLKYLVV